jgi:hypothetical protein
MYHSPRKDRCVGLLSPVCDPHNNGPGDQTASTPCEITLVTIWNHKLPQFNKGFWF